MGIEKTPINVKDNIHITEGIKNHILLVRVTFQRNCISHSANIGHNSFLLLVPKAGIEPAWA